MQPVQKPHNPRTKNLIEETIWGNTLTQSIEDETKAQEFSRRITRGSYQFPTYGLAGVVEKNHTMRAFLSFSMVLHSYNNMKTDAAMQLLWK